MKRFFGKRRVTRPALGEIKARPLGRLGALVFQLDNSETLYWASLWAPTRIAGCALGPCGPSHPLEKRCLRKTPTRPTEPCGAKPKADDVGGGGRCQGIA